MLDHFYQICILPTGKNALSTSTVGIDFLYFVSYFLEAQAKLDLENGGSAV